VTRRRAAVALALALALAAAAPLPAQAPVPGTASAQARLPRVHVDVPGAIPNEPKVRGTMRVSGGGGRAVRTRIGIEQRGHSSRRFPKKSYALETRTRSGRNRDVSLLGLPADDDWVLYGPYNDKTLVRNVLAYDTARMLGRYASRARFVELWLDRRYHGVYVLMEQLELTDGRIEVPGQGISGAYLLEMTFRHQAPGGRDDFVGRYARLRPIVFADPDRDELSAREAGWIRRYVLRAERALYTRGFRSPTRGWRAYVDEAAAVDFVLVQELFKNQDAFRGSTFLTKPAGGRLMFGPVWDFDVSSGNSNYGESRRLERWMLRGRDWGGRLYHDPAFTDAMAARWRELRAAGLREQMLAALDGYTAELRGSVRRNFRRWPVLDRRVWPNPVARGSWDAEMRALRSWLVRRIAWIDRNVGRL
jgi:hypothetical protein